MDYVILEKAKPYTRIKRGKLERVKGYSGRVAEGIKVDPKKLNEESVNKRLDGIKNKYGIKNLQVDLQLSTPYDNKALKIMSSRLDIVEREIKNVEKAIRFKGRNKLQIQIVDYDDITFGDTKAWYYSDSQTIEINPKYETSFAHEYGHFLYYEVMKVSDSVNRRASSEFMRTLFGDEKGLDKNKVKKAFDAMTKKLPNAVVRDIVSKYGEFFLNNFDRIPKLKENSEPSYRKVYNYYEYFCDPTEIVARVVENYTVGLHSDKSLIDKLPGFKALSKQLGDKYFKKEIYKSMSYVMIEEV